MAARSLLQLFRAVNPTLLARKDRVCCLKPVWVRSCLLMALLLRVGADADSCARVATRKDKNAGPAEYGGTRVAEFVPGTEVLAVRVDPEEAAAAGADGEDGAGEEDGMSP